MLLQYWDLQGGSLMGEVELRTKPCAMDASNLFVILGLFDGTVSVYDLENPYAIAREFDFHHEPRVVTLLPERRSALGLNSRPSVFFAVGRMDGRVSIQAARAAHAAEKAGDSASFNFQAHRVPVTEEYPLPPAVDAGAVRMGRVFHITPVNAVAAHPNGSVCTGGGDGSLAFWDIRGKQRLKVWTAEDFGNGAPNVKVPGTMPVWGVPVVAVAYNFSGTVAAYAFSYDWSKGHMGVPVGVNATRIMLHPLLPEEMSKV
jgi:mRNA export factor